MTRTVNFKGTKLTLVGRAIAEETIAPDFTVVSGDLKEFKLSDIKEPIKIINSFPSLDTEICDLQVKEFNKRAKALSKDIKIIGISKDLPFAQKRFCMNFGIDNISIFSDYKTSSFGINYGLLIKELNLLSRAAIILNKDNIIKYIQIGNEITGSLNFNEIFSNLEKTVKNPETKVKKTAIPLKCLPCEGKGFALSPDKIKSSIQLINEWELVEDKKIVKKFKFKDFAESKYFLDLIAVIAEEQGHHPSLTLNYNILTVSLSTHAVKGLTENDFIFAKIIDELTY